MNDWFSWNGVKCTEYGLHVLEQPPITIPAERATFTNVPGRPGSLTTLEGDDVYDDLILTAQCMISDPSNIRTIASYLKGSGKVTFANRPSGFYYARIVNQIPFEKILRGNPHRSFAVNFRCQPFWYPENVPVETLTASTSLLNNPGSVYSEPTITVYGSGEITLFQENQSFMQISFLSRAAAVWSASQSQPPESGYPARPALPSAVLGWWRTRCCYRFCGYRCCW